MSIEVKFFASLREQVGQERALVEPEAGLSAADVWQRSTGDQALPPNVLVAVNMEYAAPDAPVQDGDEVAFFPPVTGGAG